MDISEHGNISTSGQLHWVIDQRPSFALIFSLNIFLAFTATLGNTLILIELHKVSSIHPPTKCLLRCLAMTDFCVGIIVQPLFAAEIASGNWHILELPLSFFTLFSCGFSLTTAIAISVDRLLALLLGLRYRHTVTLRRVRWKSSMHLQVPLAIFSRQRRVKLWWTFLNMETFQIHFDLFFGWFIKHHSFHCSSVLCIYVV